MNTLFGLQCRRAPSLNHSVIMAAKFVTDAVHYAITLENGTKNMFQEASWLARTGEIRTCVLMSMFAGCCAPRDRCSPDPIWRTSSTPLDQLELPKGATV